MPWGAFDRECWGDLPRALEGPVGVDRPPYFGGGQWLVVALPSHAAAAHEALRDARAMGVKATGLFFSEDLDRETILEGIDPELNQRPGPLDERSAAAWARAAKELLATEPEVRQVLLVGTHEPLCASLRGEFRMAGQFRLDGDSEPGGVEDILAVLLHSPRCC